MGLRTPYLPSRDLLQPSLLLATNLEICCCFFSVDLATGWVPIEEEAFKMEDGLLMLMLVTMGEE